MNMKVDNLKKMVTIAALLAVMLAAPSCSRNNPAKPKPAPAPAAPAAPAPLPPKPEYPVSIHEETYRDHKIQFVNVGNLPIPLAPAWATVGNHLALGLYPQMVRTAVDQLTDKLDFRFKVIDPDKAQPLLMRKVKPYLVDEATGQKTVVPVGETVGTLRQTTQKPVAGRIYFIFFGNPGNTVKPGSKVTIVIGDFKAEHIEVAQ